MATCGALGMAFKRMNERDALGYQRWLRARVLAQGLTIVAIVVAGVQEVGMGALTGQMKRVAPPATSVGETREFKKRLKEAEEAHRVETLITARSNRSTPATTQRTPAAQEERNFAPNSGASSGPGHTHSPSQQPSSSRSSSWLAWLGLRRS